MSINQQLYDTDILYDSSTVRDYKPDGLTGDRFPGGNRIYILLPIGVGVYPP